MQKTYKLGFTLIEILFVIAILSVLASLGISVLQQRAQQLKVERTALQMQQILQAGMSYKSDSTTQQWPDCTDQTFKDKYLPTGVSPNPWGYAYSCGKPGGKEVFQVKVQVPNDKIVDQIKALLPNAGAISPATTPPTVFTEVSGTGGGTTTEDVVLKNIGVMPTITNSDFTHPGSIGVYTATNSIPVTCPSNMVGHLLFLPQDLMTGDQIHFDHAANTIKELQYDENCTPRGGSIVSCLPKITFQTRYHTGEGTVETRAATDPYGGSAGYLSLSYISYCKKP